MENDLQARVQRLLDRLVASGTQRGLQTAVYLDGKPVASAWAGIADHGTGRAVKESTLFPVFSATKGLVATLAHQLVEAGKISYDTPMADVWPEFAGMGKAGITLRHALNHTAGLAGLPPETSFADLADWTRMCAILAGEAPSSPPGSVAEYHAVTFGWLVGEVLRRVDGRDVPRLLHDNIAAPLGVADEMFCGLPAALEDRVAVLEDPAAGTVPPPGSAAAPVPAGMMPLHDFMNRSDMRRACIPGSNGIMSARALARHYAALLPGGVEGIELLPPARVRLATENQRLKNAGGEESGWALGYQRRAGRATGAGEAFGHRGHGGSTGFADPSRGLAVGITRNLFNDEDAAELILAEVDLALAGR